MMVALMFVAGLLCFTDRNLFPVLAQSIKTDLALSDTELGILGGPGFAFIYTITGLPIARLADRRGRIGLLALSTAVWSLFCASCGLAGNFWHLLIGRAGVGVGEAGFMPASTSLVADHFPPAKRASVLSIIQLGSPASTILCAVLAGSIGAAWGWRWALIAIGLPGVPLALIVRLLLREPKRGMFDPAPAGSGAALPWRLAIAGMLGKPAFVLVMFAAALVTFSVNAMAQFYVSYFVRIHHWTVAQGGYAFGVIQCSAATIGLLAGGFGADWLAQRDERWRCWLPAIALTIACFFYLAGFSRPTPMAAAGLILLGGIFLFTFYMPSLGMVQSMASADARATSVAVFSIAGTVLGSGFGPLASGFASDLFAARHFAPGHFIMTCPGGKGMAGASAAIDQACRAASASGLQGALLLSPLPLLLSACLYLVASRTLRRDMRENLHK
jgi:predicted MFS family arabinose efflux permease